MKHIGLGTLGRDAELKTTNGGNKYANLSIATAYRDGNERKTQWVSATLWGQQAEALAPYLTKGSVHCFALSDLHVTMKDGKAYLNARCDSVELGPKKERAEAPAAAPRAAPAGNQGFDDMDDDIPF